MKQTIFVLLLLVLIASPVVAQECGPGCPTCSGSGNNASALLATGDVAFSYLFVPDGEEETSILNLRTGITSWMDAGLGYGFKGEKVIWNLRIQALGESEAIWRPALLVGTGSVQTGKSDQSLYVQAVKSFKLTKSSTLRLSAGAVSLIPDFDEVYGLAGATVSYNKSFSVFVNYDGKAAHPGISWNPYSWLTIAGILIESETPALNIGLKFNL